MSDWWRSWHGAPTDPKWMVIARKAGVPTAYVVAVAWALLDRASQAKERGSIEGYDAEALGCFLGIEGEQVDAIIEAMRVKGTVAGHRFVAWEKRQPKREDNSTDRVTAFREREAAKRRDHETDETQCNAEKRNETLEESRGDKPTSQDNSESSVVGARARKARRAKPRTAIAPDAQPTERDRQIATEHRLSPDQFRVQWRKFRSHHIAKGSLMADWSAAWDTWCGNIHKFDSEQAKNEPKRTVHDAASDLHAKVIAALEQPRPPAVLSIADYGRRSSEEADRRVSEG